MLDAESLAARSRRVIEQAASLGECVIVGRGLQCALAGRADVLHVFVFAPAEERIRRARERGMKGDLGALIAVDRERGDFTRTLYGRDWRDPQSPPHAELDARDRVADRAGRRGARQVSAGRRLHRHVPPNRRG